MADHGVQIDESYVEWLRTAPDSPVVKALDEAGDELLAEAIALAPASPVGSRYAPPGFLKTRIAKTGVKHADDGSLEVLVGVPLRLASRFPLPFVDNPSGITWNRGHKSARLADDDFLGRAVDMFPTHEFFGD